ncbi:MAG: ABC transporter permease [Clostridia bacterium]|nr:ABC transporter permease [Clostridia bacterium]
MFAIYKRELKSYLTNMIGCVFISVLLIIVGIFVTVMNLLYGYPLFEYSISNLTPFLFVLIPILTMRSVSEERHAKTDQLLYSLPVSVGNVVLAKYFAMITVFLIPTVIMAFYPLILSIFGNVPFASAYGDLLGFMLLVSALISVGLFISSITESQVIAAVVSAGVLLGMYLMSVIAGIIPSSAFASLIGFAVVMVLIALIVWRMTKNATVAGIVCVAGLFLVGSIYLIDSTLFEGLFPRVLNWLSVFDRFDSFSEGLFDLTTIVYYLSISALFVFSTIQSVEKRRWS